MLLSCMFHQRNTPYLIEINFTTKYTVHGSDHGWPSTQPGTCTQLCPIVHTAVPPLFTQPCPGEQWTRLCVFTLQGCVQAARLCRGSPVVTSQRRNNVINHDATRLQQLVMVKNKGKRKIFYIVGTLWGKHRWIPLANRKFWRTSFHDMISSCHRPLSTGQVNMSCSIYFY